MFNESICLYHKDCFDGLGAAYAVWKAFPDCTMHAIQHGEPRPSVAGKRVFMVDFSLPYEKMLELIDEAEEVIVLDHHETFAAGAAQLIADRDSGRFGDKYVDIVFDQSRSGALIAWEYLHVTPAPQLIRHISDRDLGEHKLPQTRAVMAAVGLVPYVLDDYVELIENGPSMDELAVTGKLLLTKLERDIENVIRTTQRQLRLKGHPDLVPVVNCPYWLATATLERLALQHPYAISYFDNEKERVFSLRSNKASGIDVEQIAKQYGGGGHRNAAGFRAPRYSALAEF